MRFPRSMVVPVITAVAVALLIPLVRTTASAEPPGDGSAFGELVDPAAYSAVVALTHPVDRGWEISHFCDGTLVAPDKVVTAATCVDLDVPYGVSEGKPRRAIDVVAGLRDASDATQAGHRVRVESVWLHPETVRRARPIVNLAILTLTEPLPARYQPLPIAGPDDTGLTAPDTAGATGARGTVVGYGSALPSRPERGPLERSTVSFVPDDRCRPEVTKVNERLIRPFVPESMACIQGVEALDGACSGFPGGPVIVNGKLAAVDTVKNFDTKKDQDCGTVGKFNLDRVIAFVVPLAPYSNDLVHRDRVYRCGHKGDGTTSDPGFTGEMRIADEPPSGSVDQETRGRRYKVSYRITKNGGVHGGNKADIDFENDGSKWSTGRGKQDGTWHDLGPVHAAGLRYHQTDGYDRTPLIIFDMDSTSGWKSAFTSAEDPFCSLDIPINP